MAQAISERVDEYCQTLETRLGLLLSSLVIGLLLLGCAMIYVQPSFTPAFHGIYFSELSEHPFDFSENNRMRYRILAPLLGYLVFLKGKYFFILPLLFSWFLITAVYYHYRRKNFPPSTAFLFSCLLAFSCTILIPLIAAGYTDTISYFFLFLAFVRAERVFQSAVFFSLALLNHESSAFLLPALIFYSKEKQPATANAWIKTILIFCLACIPHLLYRSFINMYATVQYSLPYYFSSANVSLATKNVLEYLPAASFFAFKLLWFFPLAAIYYSVKTKSFSFLTTILLIITGVFAQLIIAYDYTRLIALAFPAILLSAEWIRNHWGERKFRKFALALVLLNFLILQYHYAKEEAYPMFPLFF